MVRCERVIVVEGRYDKIKLSNLVEGTIIPCGGFSLFHNEGKKREIRTLARQKGAVILTDSDVAGFQIRSYLKNYLAGCDVVDAYIPDIYGKERRKARPSKEGKLGVEGVPGEVLLRALRTAGALADGAPRPREITRLDLYNWGLVGGADSAARRGALLARLDLPENLSPKGLLGAVNDLCTREELAALAEELGRP